MENEKNLTIAEAAKQSFELACKDAAALKIGTNCVAAFSVVNIITSLQNALTDEVMGKFFMPLMNRKIGFLTDRTGKPNRNGQTLPLYPVSTVRDCLIDAICLGLLPTGNQFNIIAGNMYPTKEGYTKLLKDMGVKYIIEKGMDQSKNDAIALIPCKISYTYNGEKASYTLLATVKKDSYSSSDQLRGKAERAAKKSLYEYITGTDYGDADETSSAIDITPVEEKVNEEFKEMANRETLNFDNAEVDTETGEIKNAGGGTDLFGQRPEQQPAQQPAQQPTQRKGPNF